MSSADNADSPSSEPTEAVPSNHRTKMLVLLGAGVIIIILALVGFLLLNGNGNSPAGTASGTKQFRNWLKPAAEIKVGKYRYVSACQALPRPTIEAIFGKLSSNTVVQEHYLDRSVSQSSLPLRLSCNYNHVSGNGQDIKLDTQQYTDQAKAKDISYTLGSFRDEQVQAELDLYERAVTAGKNKTARDFLDELKNSFAIYKQYRAETDPAKRAAIDVDGLVLPVSQTLTGALDDFAFVGLQNNIVYTLGHTPAGAKGRNDLSKYSNQELQNELLTIKKATEAVRKNLRNKTLDQSPAPTILGSTDKYGSTTILEPCAIMSPTVFSQITGGQHDNNPVERTTASLNFTTKRYTKQDHKLILPSNSCTRQADNTYASFSLEYGSSTSQATAWLNDGYAVSSSDTSLQTAADWAVAFANPINPGGPPVIVFRVGPYIGHISIHTAATGQADIEATTDQYVQAINALTAAIKQAQTLAKT